MTFDDAFDKALDEACKQPNSGIRRRTIHLIPIHDAQGLPAGKLWQVKEPGPVYDKLMEASGTLPSHIVIVKLEP